MLFPSQTARQYEEAFRQHYDSFTVANLGEPNRVGQNCYDATWILALALNNTLTGMVLYAVVYSTILPVPTSLYGTCPHSSGVFYILT